MAKAKNKVVISDAEDENRIIQCVVLSPVSQNGITYMPNELIQLPKSKLRFLEGIVKETLEQPLPLSDKDKGDADKGDADKGDADKDITTIDGGVQ